MLKNGINKYDIEKSFYINNNFINSHVGDQGNKIIAEKIYEEILPIINQDINKLNS
jgi:hypothetical protein